VREPSSSATEEWRYIETKAAAGWDVTNRKNGGWRRARRLNKRAMQLKETGRSDKPRSCVGTSPCRWSKRTRSAREKKFLTDGFRRKVFEQGKKKTIVSGVCPVKSSKARLGLEKTARKLLREWVAEKGPKGEALYGEGKTRQTFATNRISRGSRLIRKGERKRVRRPDTNSTRGTKRQGRKKTKSKKKEKQAPPRFNFKNARENEH